MNTTTKSAFIFSFTYFIFFGVILGWGAFVVSSKGNELEAQLATASEHAAKEQAYNNISRITMDTQEERSQLQSFFVTENNTIDFISGIEEAARIMNIKLETTNLSVIKGKKEEPSVLEVGFRFVGNEEGVKEFVRLLESVPYHKTILNLNISSQTTSGWGGDITFHFTIL